VTCVYPLVVRFCVRCEVARGLRLRRCPHAARASAACPLPGSRTARVRGIVAARWRAHVVARRLTGVGTAACPAARDAGPDPGRLPGLLLGGLGAVMLCV
jgi:hypothetical protein